MVIGFSMIRLTNFLCLYTIFLVTVLCTVHMRPGLVKIYIGVRFFATMYKVSAMGLKINNINYEELNYGSHVPHFVFYVAFFWVCTDVGPYNHVQLFSCSWWALKVASFCRRGERNIRLFASPDRLHHFMATTHFNRPMVLSSTLTL
jgi:hypothetical protein